jgi:phosphotransferase system enzyme I (PtsI)
LIYANAGNENEAEAAELNGADGIGLLRSEFLYLSIDRYPTEAELYNAYCGVLCKMKGKRVVIRTLDIGADKRISYFDLPEESNPAMGFRAVRICLAREKLFKTQLRAILRASASGSISIMIPMIISVEEVRRCKAILEECKKELSREGKEFDAQIEFGIMIETPAAAIMSRELAAEVDFFSVGTNDLTQYTLAVDRQNPLVANLAEKNLEPILRLIEKAAHAIHEAGGWIGICGELAADLHLTQRFADMGIDELSVSPPYLLGVREKVTECK